MKNHTNNFNSTLYIVCCLVASDITNTVIITLTYSQILHGSQTTTKVSHSKKIFSPFCGLKKDNRFLYLLSFPSLIESRTKVKQHKDFSVSYKKHLSKHIVQGHAGAINNPLRPASPRLVQV